MKGELGMKIAIIGCGYVFDIYMRTLRAHPELEIMGVYDRVVERTKRVSEYYGFRAYTSYSEVLTDEEVETVVNLTNIGSHFEVSRKALNAGKHVYSEKPLTKDLDQSRELFRIASERGVRLYGAPSNIYSDTSRTVLTSVSEGLIGKPLLVYAELDDSPIHLMGFDGVVSRTGAPWPLQEEVREGCTFEHLGYHLVWICALLGPAVSVTAFSSELIEGKAQGLPGFVGTPDYSVANLQFANGAVARITCSVVAPRDHSFRVIGRDGQLSVEGYRRYRSPVRIERFTKASLMGRKFDTLQRHPMLSSFLGIGGRRVELARNWKSEAVEKDNQIRSSRKQRVIEWLRRREVYAQDKLVGVAEMAKEIKERREQYLTPEFLLHLNELTLLTQGARAGIAVSPTTTFEPLGPVPGTRVTGTAPRLATSRALGRLVSLFCRQQPASTQQNTHVVVSR